MSKTKIEWCIKPGTKPETWNPTTGCNKVSQGCKNCYAEIMHKRLMGMYPSKYNQPFLDGAVAHEDTLLIPFKWKTPRTVFVNSMSDLFHHKVSFEFIKNVFITMALTPQHTYIILTKRPHIMKQFFEELNINELWYAARSNALRKGLDMFDKTFPFPLPNVWLGVSCENQETADERIPLLLQVPAAIKFLSCEPLLGMLNITNYLYEDLLCPSNKIHWVITGGESGYNARPMHPDWARFLRDQCKAADVPFFFKQWGEWLPIKFKDNVPSKICKQIGRFTSCHLWIKGENVNEEIYPNAVNMVKVGKKQAGRLLDGVEHNEFPNLA